MTDILLLWEDTLGMQVCTDIGSESDGYPLTVGGYSGMQVCIDISNKSDGYPLTVGGYSGMQVCIDISNNPLTVGDTLGTGMY